MTKKKRREQDNTLDISPPVLTANGFRRGLLGVVTALVVARPLVLGEDPGMLNPLTDSAPLFLPFFWLLALLAWAIWRFCTRQVDWHLSLVEALLLLGGVAVAASTYVAPYKHPGLLVSWEWLTYFFALLLLRQLATTASDQRHLAAAFLATAVMLAVYGIYQYHVELPQLAERLEQPDDKEVRAAAWVSGYLGVGQAGPLPAALLLDWREVNKVGVPGIDDELTREQKRGLVQHALATYSHPSSLAALLVLLLPAMFVAGLLWRRQGSAVLGGLTFACVVVTVGALWLTHSKSALLALSTASLVGILIALRRGVTPAKPWLIGAGLLVAFMTTVGFGLFDSAGVGACERLEERTGDRTTAATMIAKNPWLGVGAGNYSRACSRYLEAGAEPSIGPRSFVLELWATSGVVAALAVLAAFALFFWYVLRQHPPLPPPSAEEASLDYEGTRWEFYGGGIAGLLLAFALRQSGQSPDEVLGGLVRTSADILLDALSAVGRGFIWFAAFALFEGVRWPGRWLSMTLAVGVGAAVLLLAVSGGIGFPSVALPLWLVVGLALCGLGLPAWKPATASPLPYSLPLPLAIGFFLAFVYSVLDPVVRSASLVRSAALAGQQLDNDSLSGRRQIPDRGRFMFDNIIKPLDNAVKEDPGNARWHIHRATWYSRLWRTAVVTGDRKGQHDYSNNAANAALEAEQLDPDGREGYLMHMRLSLLYAESQNKERRQLQLNNAVTAMTRLADRDPTNPQMHYQLARVLLEAGDREQARESAANALATERPQSRPPRKLTEWQRFQLELWSK